MVTQTPREDEQANLIDIIAEEHNCSREEAHKALIDVLDKYQQDKRAEPNPLVRVGQGEYERTVEPEDVETIRFDRDKATRKLRWIVSAVVIVATLGTIVLIKL